MVELICPQCTAQFSANPGAVASCPNCDYHGGRVPGRAPQHTYIVAEGEFSHKQESLVVAPGEDEKPERSTAATTALVLGLCFFVPPAGIFAIMFGVIALSQIRESTERKDKVTLKGRGMAIAGIVMGAIFQLVWFLVIILALAGLASGLDQILGR